MYSAHERSCEPLVEQKDTVTCATRVYTAPVVLMTLQSLPHQSPLLTNPQPALQVRHLFPHFHTLVLFSFLHGCTISEKYPTQLASVPTLESQTFVRLPFRDPSVLTSDTTHATPV
uniref:Uncharacterized protein n=1 Tax=Lygus hesperus TaxID=30085 RepID=A0A0A9XCH7_LYGHE